MSDNRRILVVDDDQSVCRLVRTHLSANGYTVEVASDGNSGLKKAADFKPCVVILDLLLPGMDGFQVCRHIRENPALAGTHILMLTAVYLSEEDKLNGFRVGADEYIVKPDVILSKPIHLKELKETVDGLFQGRIEPPSLARKQDRVLIVDDDQRNLRLMKMRLMSEDFEVAEAATGQAALDQMEPFQPQLVLLDYNMPGMSGLDVLKEIRGRDLDTPVIMMTAYGSESVAVESFKLGADDYLIKPFDTALAAQRLRQIAESYRLRKSRDRLTERLKKISCDLVNRVNHLELQNHKLEEAYSLVQGLSEFNRRFIKSLSQELREPLAMILGFASLLRDTSAEERDADAERECLAAIFRTAFRLEVNLSNLIYQSRIQADAIAVMPGTLTMEPVVENALALARRALARDDIHIKWYPEKKTHQVVGDSALLKDILINLLDSSIQRMEGAGEIAVEIFNRKDPGDDDRASVSLQIQDNGTNYTDEDLAAFDVADPAMDSQGLGSENLRLNLCRHLALLLNWDLEIANNPRGGGRIVLTMRG
jgi:DNA-binding response OmpR family regulator